MPFILLFISRCAKFKSLLFLIMSTWIIWSKFEFQLFLHADITLKEIFKLVSFLAQTCKIRLFTNPLPTTVQCWPRYTRTLVYGTFAAAEAHSHHCTARWQWRGVLSAAAAGCGGTELLHNRENNIFLLYPLSPTLIHHSLTQHVHHGHHAALANNWGSSETLIQAPFLPLCISLSKESNPSVYVQYIR